MCFVFMVFTEGSKVLPVTLVPGPGVVTQFGSEIWLASIVDLGGEAEQAAVGAMVVLFRSAGQAVLLKGAL